MNGRRFGVYAASSYHYKEEPDPDHPGRNLRSRHYKITVSKNKRDDGYANTRKVSENW